MTTSKQKHDPLNYNTHVRYSNVRAVIMRKAVHLKTCPWNRVIAAIYCAPVMCQKWAAWSSYVLFTCPDFTDVPFY